MRHAQPCRCADCIDAEIRAGAARPGAQPNIEAAARTLASCMDFPWEHMPEQGRQTMRKHAQAVLDAAQKVAPCS